MWTHLRHDTILYAKQSYTLPWQCLFPAGYVEPRAEFWGALRLLALRTAEIVRRLRVSGTYPTVQHQPEVTHPQTGEVIVPEAWVPVQVPLSDIRARQVAHLERFADTVHRLELLVAKQLAQECFNPEDERFIDSLMIEQVRKGGGSSHRPASPQLERSRQRAAPRRRVCELADAGRGKRWGSARLRRSGAQSLRVRAGMELSGAGLGLWWSP